MRLDFSSWPLGCVSNSPCRWFGFQCRPSNNIKVVESCRWQIRIADPPTQTPFIFLYSSASCSSFLVMFHPHASFCISSFPSFFYPIFLFFFIYLPTYHLLFKYCPVHFQSYFFAIDPHLPRFTFLHVFRLRLLFWSVQFDFMRQSVIIFSLEST